MSLINQLDQLYRDSIMFIAMTSSPTIELWRGFIVHAFSSKEQ